MDIQVKHNDSYAPLPLNATGWKIIAGLAVVSILLAISLVCRSVDYLLIIASLAQAVYAGYLLRREYIRRELLSPVALYSFLILLHFAIPGILITIGGIDFDNPDNLAVAFKAQLFVLISFIFFHCGCAVILGRHHRYKKSGKKGGGGRWHSGNVKLVVLAFSILGWLDRIHIVFRNAYFHIDRNAAGDLSEHFHAALRLAERLPGIALIIIWIFFFQQRSEKFSRWWWLGCTYWIAELVYWVPSGCKEEIILALFFPLMIRYLFTLRLPSFRAGLVIIVSVVLLFPVAYYYRAAMRDVASDHFVAVIRTSAITMHEAEQLTEKKWWSILCARISLVESVSASIRVIDTDHWPPFLGKTYRFAIFSIVPRVLWKDKPGFNYGNKFGHAAGILHASDNWTSVSITYFGEAYLNFLWLGVLVVFFIGIIFSLIYRSTFNGRFRSTWVFLYAMTLPVILYIGGNFALYFSGLFQKLILFGGVAFFMSCRFRPLTQYRQGRLR